MDYEIRLETDSAGQLRRKLTRSWPMREDKLSGKPVHRRVFYDDGVRRILYEIDVAQYRYVLECELPNGGLQRTVFPTLHDALFCLTGCVKRDE